MAYEHVLPAGLRLDDPGSVALEEWFETEWMDDGEEPSHYVFRVQVGALRVERLMSEALAALPDAVHAVLEVRRPVEELDNDPDGPAVRRWVSPVVPRDAVLRTWRRHAGVLVHDGMPGFGAWDPDTPLEVFLDDHKLLSLFSPQTEPFESLLRRHRVPEGKGLATVVDADHQHVSIARLCADDPEARRVWGRSKSVDVAWVASSIRGALRMRLQGSPAADES